VPITGAMAGDCAWRVWQKPSRRSGGVVLMLRGFGQITNRRTRRTRKIQENFFGCFFRVLRESLASFASGCLDLRPLPMKNFCLQRLSSKRKKLSKL
jgi:hypothetical protein